jgi:hypothetical protein
MNYSKRKTLFLLGAGASVTAGIPTATQMPKAMIEKLEYTPIVPDQTVLRALKLAVGVLRLQKSITGGSPYDEVNIEEVFNAIDLLNRRGQLEFSQFVGTWHPEVQAIESSTGRKNEFVNDLKRVLENEDASSAFSLERSFVSSVQAISKTGSGKGFTHTLDRMFSMLLDMTWLKEETNVEYLYPLVRFAKTAGSPIISLNYDNATELSCSKIDVEYDTGIGEWSSSRSIQFRPDSVRLIKLHGSVNWIKTPEEPTQKRPIASTTIRSVPLSPRPSLWTGKNSAYLIFGGHNKLTAEGPFLDLFRAFQNLLESTEHVVVIGYSFADAHVNHLFINWINADTTHSMQIINGKNFELHQTRLFNQETVTLLNNRVENLKEYAQEGIALLFPKDE